MGRIQQWLPLFAWLVALSEGQELCEPCMGAVDASLSFDGLACTEWLHYASQIPANTEECALERLLGWKFCGCPAQTNERCTFCGPDKTGLQLDKQLPFSSITCQDFVDVPKIDGDTTCAMADTTASYCGCQSQRAQCTLCPDGAPPQNMDAPLYLGMTCADIHDLYLVSSKTRCGELENDYPFDLQAYCGCNSIPKPENGCNFCPYGGQLKDPERTLESDETSTCGDWATLASYAKSGESSCAVFQYVGLECCDDMDLPELFSHYVKGNGELQQGVVNDGASDTTSVTEPVAEEQQPPLTIEAEFQGDLQNAFDSQGDASELYVDAAFADNISMAIFSCFSQYTTKQNSNEDHLSLHNVSGVDKAQSAMGDLFHDARKGSVVTVSSNATDADDKWDRLFKDLTSKNVPADFRDMVPNEFADSLFENGLPGCLDNALDSFSTCPLCQGGEKPSRPERIIPVVGLYCFEIEEWKADAVGEECEELHAWMPFDLSSWCGCPGVPDLGQKDLTALTGDEDLETNPVHRGEKCPFCPEGSVLVLDSWEKTINNATLTDGYEVESTCSEWAQMADYATTEESCDFLRLFADSGCCEPIPDSSAERTPAPFPGSGETTVTSAPTIPRVPVEPASASRATSYFTAILLAMGLSFSASLL